MSTPEIRRGGYQPGQTGDRYIPLNIQIQKPRSLPLIPQKLPIATWDSEYNLCFVYKYSIGEGDMVIDKKTKHRIILGKYLGSNGCCGISADTWTFEVAQVLNPEKGQQLFQEILDTKYHSS